MFFKIDTAINLVVCTLGRGVSLFCAPARLIGNGPSNAGPRMNRHLHVNNVIITNAIGHSDRSLRISFGITSVNPRIAIVFSKVLPSLFHRNRKVMTRNILISTAAVGTRRMLTGRSRRCVPPRITSTVGGARRPLRCARRRGRKANR